MSAAVCASSGGPFSTSRSNSSPPLASSAIYKVLFVVRPHGQYRPNVDRTNQRRSTQQVFIRESMGG